MSAPNCSPAIGHQRCSARESCGFCRPVSRVRAFGHKILVMMVHLISLNHGFMNGLMDPVPARYAIPLLRNADPVLARLVDERPQFDPRAWIAELPPMDLYGSLLFQVTGL